jgi:Fe-S-cluster containining protein
MIQSRSAFSKLGILMECTKFRLCNCPVCWKAPMPVSPINPDQEILTAVSRAYTRFGQDASAWIENFTRQGGTVHCRSGCVHCCNFPVRVSLAEALLTASQLSNEQLEAMKLRASQVLANAKTASSWDEYFARHREQIGYCPLLDQTTGACTAYEVRPGRCRDTFSALSAHYCQVGTLEHLNRSERFEYKKAVKANSATDGLSHYIAPLEDLGHSIWQVASRQMRQSWGLEVWGDFWVLTTLSQDAAFLVEVRAGKAKSAVKRAKALGLWHLEIVQIQTSR